MPPRRRSTRRKVGVEEAGLENGKKQVEVDAAPNTARRGTSAGKVKRTEPIAPSQGKKPRLDPDQLKHQDASESVDKRQSIGRKRRSPTNRQVADNKKIKKVKHIKEEDVKSVVSVINTKKKTNIRAKSKTLKSEETLSAQKSPEDSDTDDSDFEDVEAGGSVPVTVDRSLCTETDGQDPVRVDRSLCDGQDNIGTKLSSESGESDFEEVVPSSVDKPASMKTTGKKQNKKSGIKKSKGNQKGKNKVNRGKDKDMKKGKADLSDPIPMVPTVSALDEDDVTAVLLHMEGSNCSLPSTSEGQGHRGSEVKGSSLSDDSDGSEDWEEVEEHDGRSLLSRVPTEPVEITLDAPDFLNKKRKKKQFDWEGYVQRTMRRFQKDVQINMHKVQLLCLLAHGFRQNAECNREVLMALALSILPPDWSITSLPDLKNFLKWFQHEFPLHTTSSYFSRSDEQTGVVKCEYLQSLLSSKQISCAKSLVILFVVMLRCLGVDVRLVMSFQPMKMKLDERNKFNLKQKSRENTKKSSEKGDERKSEHFKKKSKSGETCKSVVNKSCKDNTKRKQPKNKQKAKLSKGKQLSIKEDSNNLDTGSKVKQEKKDKDCKAKRRKVSKGRELCEEVTSSEEEEEVKFERNLRVREPRRSVKQEDEESAGVSEEEEESEEEFVVEEEKRSRRNSSKSSEQKGGKKLGKSRRKVKKETNVSSESEFEDSETQFRSPLQEKLRRNRKVLSSDLDRSSDSDRSHTAHGVDSWTEVYLSGEDRWICVDCINAIIDKPYELEAGATQPVHYVLAYTSAGYVSDVTARYASQWMSQTRKLRVDADWWKDTLESYRSPVAEQAEKDEETIKGQLLRRPLPTSVGEFKNHPLYALPRHLLKFEAIYPTTAAPFGYIRGEAIYARECVHTLHSRENWLKEGRCVRVGEEAYKMVKSRKRWRETKPNPDALDLELFGSWQTEKYIPPPAVDGKIERNVYGNIELFKPWMLPAGTVHLQGFPALNRISKKLDMDCVPAMVGWDSHGGFPHPLIDGWVVCEEQKDILIAAWDEEQEIQREREIERREKRVLGNWKLLTRSLLIRERLKKKFDLKDEAATAERDEEEGKGKKGKKKKTVKGEKARDVQQSWPRNRKVLTDCAETL